MIVISDDENKLHGIGGVMGGLNSGCSLETKNVFLEVALFDPVSVTKTGRKLNLQSDASLCRFNFLPVLVTETGSNNATSRKTFLVSKLQPLFRPPITPPIP